MNKADTIDLYADMVLECCDSPVRLEDIQDEVGIPEDDVHTIVDSLIGRNQIETYKHYYFTPSERNRLRAKVFTLPRLAKILYHELADFPKTISQIKAIHELKGENVNHLLGQLRTMGLLIEDSIPGASDLWLNKRYSTMPLYGTEAVDGDAVETAYEDPEESEEPDTATDLLQDVSTPDVTVDRDDEPEMVVRTSRASRGRGPSRLSLGVRTIGQKASIEPEMPKGSDTELWIGKGENYRTWLDNNIGYGPGFTSKELLEALLEQDIRVADLGSHGVYIREKDRDEMLRFMHARRVINVYKKSA